jgi:hypothetical protein
MGCCGVDAYAEIWTTYADDGWAWHLDQIAITCRNALPFGNGRLQTTDFSSWRLELSGMSHHNNVTATEGNDFYNSRIRPI